MLPPFVFSTTSLSCYLVNQSPLAIGVVVIRYHVDESTGHGKGGALFRRQLKLEINWDTLRDKPLTTGHPPPPPQFVGNIIAI